MEKLKKKFFIGKTSKRFIMSFLSVLILPMICFTVLFQQNFRDIYRRKIVEQAQSNLNIVGRELEQNIENLHTFKDYNAIDSKLQKLVLQDAWGLETVNDTLFATIVSYPFLDDVFYYNRTSPNIVYNSEGTYTTYYFAKLKGGMESEDQLLEFLEDIQWAEWRMLGNDLVYVVRDGNYAWWIFKFDILELKYLLMSENSVTSLLDMNGTLLYEVGDVYPTDCFEIRFSSAQNSFELIRRIETTALFGELDVWQQKFVLMINLILMAGGILVLVLTYYNGKPIKRLLEYSRDRIPNIPADMDGLEAFHFTLKSLEEQAAYKSKKQERDYLLLKLIYGHECDTEAFQNSIKEAALFEYAQCYRVIMITSKEDKDINYNKIDLYLNVQKKIDYEFYLTDLYTDDAAVMVVGMTENADSGLKNELILMSETIGDSIEGGLRFFVGGKGIKFNEVHRSYAQAYACMKKFDGEELVNFYTFSEKEDKTYQYPKDELRILYDALIETDLCKASAITDSLVTVLEMQSTNEFIRVALYYDILNTYYRALVKLKKDEELDLTEAYLLVMDSGEKAVSMIYHILDQYQAFVERQNSPQEYSSEYHKIESRSNKANIGKKDKVISYTDKEKSTRSVQHVINYIDENIQSGDLNVSSVADYFGLSISQLSHRFKEQTKQNISDFITEKNLHMPANC